MDALPPPSGAPSSIPLPLPPFALAEVPPPPVYAPAATFDPLNDVSLAPEIPEVPESGNDAPAAEIPAPISEQPNDTASLMRELSSLGLRDL